MTRDNFSDAALVLLGHGSTQNADSGMAIIQQAGELRRRRLFAEVREGFWKQEPQVLKVIDELRQPRVFIAPFFISEGYFSQNIIPRALGFTDITSGTAGRVVRRASQALFYCQVVGSHPGMTKTLAARAREVVAQFPFPRAPKPSEVTLFIAGHGTEQNEKSRESIERQVELIRALNVYAGVHAIFLEEDPRIGACYEMAHTRNIVVVPFFISDGLHVREDLPVLLGEPERLVRQRLEGGQATWRNPTEKKGKLVWLASGVGSDASMAEVVLEQVREAAGWAPM